ncbi:MAG: DEAD/DEAH box helicase [Methanomicrobiales archaeon]|nr:DEAD/DEAH box helicase [Methanomicrobiales archaeon]
MDEGDDQCTSSDKTGLQKTIPEQTVPRCLPVLHALTDPASNAIALFTEVHHSDPRLKKRGRKPGGQTLPQYPFASAPGELACCISTITGYPVDQFRTTRWVLYLPLVQDGPARSIPGDNNPGELPETASMSPFYVPVILCPYEVFMDLWAGQELLNEQYIIGDSLRYFFQLMRAATRLVRNGQFKPAIRRTGLLYHASWVPALTPGEAAWFQQFTLLLPPVCRYALPRRMKRVMVSDPKSRAFAALTAMMQAIILCALEKSPPSIRPGRRMIEGQRNELAFMADLTGMDLNVIGHLMEKEFAQKMHTWLTYSGKDQKISPFRSCIILQEPPEGSTEPWPLSLHLRSEADPSLIIPAATIWELTDEPGGMLPPVAYLQQTLLTGLGKAVSASPVIRKYLTGAKPDMGECSMAEAAIFLTTDALAVQQKGIDLLLPAWWTEQKFRPRIELSASRGSGNTGRGMLGISELISFDYRVAVGDNSLSPEEFWQAVHLKAPFVRVGGRWITCDSDALSKVLKNFEKRYIHGSPTAGDLIRISLCDEIGPGLGVSVEPRDEWAADLLTLMRSGQDLDVCPVPITFRGTLRKYQKEGHAFLLRCTERGFGACLADDMGLGKTPQAIAWLLSLKALGAVQTPALLICPMSVVGNWGREVNRFSPSLKVCIHHGAARCKGDEFIRMVSGYDLVLTTYHLAGRDLEPLSQVPWSAVILDEAQNIKNPQTNQSKAVRSIHADRRVALTGTPVENRLLELWSIMDFLNPGYLGTQHAFQSRYVSRIEQEKDPGAIKELRQLIRPFIIRRMKTDRSVITDLPEKMESRVYCSLTHEQATLYQAVVTEMAESLEKRVGIARRGAILAGITRLKQVCNHPGLIAKDTGMRPNRSGKVMRVLEMLEEVCDEGDSALIFSQYATFAQEIAAICKNHFSCPILLLTGSTPRKERENLIQQFQSGGGPVIFVISLKAGGTGLNLTAATHVFHIDRWWNPAVEDQATDRTYRIGQKRNVQVHLMIAAGTLEERIDEMNKVKRTLAAEVLAHDDDFLTSLSTQELLDIVSLRDSVFSGEED